MHNLPANALALVVAALDRWGEVLQDSHTPFGPSSLSRSSHFRVDRCWASRKRLILQWLFTAFLTRNFHCSLLHGVVRASMIQMSYLMQILLAMVNQLWGLSFSPSEICLAASRCSGCSFPGLAMRPIMERIFLCHSPSIGMLPMSKYTAAFAVLSGSPCSCLSSFL